MSPRLRRVLHRDFIARAVVAAAVAAVAAGGCVERRSPVEIRAHPDAWSAPASPDFHGARVLAKGIASCAPCHGADARGTPGVPGCSDCHAGAGGHPFGYASPSVEPFHGDAVAASGPGPCADCHGEDHRGGWSGVSCFACHAGGPSGHPDGWLEPRSSAFHGLAVLDEGVDSCTRCHGFGLGGGTSGLACGECHEIIESPRGAAHPAPPSIETLRAALGAAGD